MDKRTNFLRVIPAFLKMGTIGFGGGAVLLPLFERELVENKKWMDKESFDMVVDVASTSPASSPVSLCTIWNSRYSLLSAYAYALPGSLIYLVLLTGFSYIGKVGAEYLRFASVGLIAFVLFLLCRFIRSNLISSAKAGIKARYLSIMAAAFLLTGGNALRKLASTLFGLTLPTSIFSVNMITLMLITFFVIDFMGSSKSKIKLCVALLLGGFYALSNT